jgi:hypothetical protein
MSCGTNRCALRRFDGHGASSYRPSNPEVTKAFNSSIQAMLAERARQDAGIFTAPSMPMAAPLVTSSVSTQPIKTHLHPSNQQFYSLSDANTKS